MSWVVGIDLGTTNCTMAAVSISQESPKVVQCSISQKMEVKNDGESFLLPSFFYFPLPEEGAAPLVGMYARERGMEVPDRVIASAKSWLCHEGIDRHEQFLPLNEEMEKRSPIEVCSAFLAHLKKNWDHNHPSEPFNEQTILVTVPASFDPSARECIQEAARMSDFPNVTLIEEPLAAFYAWLHTHENTWRNHLKLGDSVLVVDIGGGTTDFSLIEVEENEGDLTLVRKAVGEHLLLGGDNIDLALAFFTQEKFSTSLDEWQFQVLVHICRRAKENLLSENAQENYEITIPGRGSRLIGGSLKTTLSRIEVETLLIDGFFPEVSRDEKVIQEKQAALSQLGLPYVRDPRISAQLALFLARSGKYPTAVLFNGGTMKAASFRTRILNLLESWSSHPIKELMDADFDFGVSRGAAYYGWTRKRNGIRVRAGTSHSYFIGIEGRAPAVPGIQPPLHAVCLVPFGLEEGSEVVLEDKTFSLLLEQPALFRFFSLGRPTLSNGEIPQVGTTLKSWKEELTELHPIEAFLPAQNKEEKIVPIKLSAKLTELGVLELWCLGPKGEKWKLEFDTRVRN